MDIFLHQLSLNAWKRDNLRFGYLALGMLLLGGCRALPTSTDQARLVTATEVASTTLEGDDLRPDSPNYDVAAERFTSSWNAFWRPERKGWQVWGKANLQTGDLVFTLGNYYVFLGAINFTELATKVCQADFSHVGMVVVEDGLPMVYDISDEGIKATPFEAYVTRSGYQTVAVRRPLESIYPNLPQCVAYLRKQRANDVRFDRKFALNNDELYCTELIYEAFNQAGVTLCEPIQVNQLPGNDKVAPIVSYLAKQYANLDDQSSLICIGNRQYGLYGSAWLEDFLSPTPIKSPPP